MCDFCFFENVEQIFKSDKGGLDQVDFRSKEDLHEISVDKL